MVVPVVEIEEKVSLNVLDDTETELGLKEEVASDIKLDANNGEWIVVVVPFVNLVPAEVVTVNDLEEDSETEEEEDLAVDK